MLICVSSVQVLTSSLSSRADDCGLSWPSLCRLQAEFEDRFHFVSHFSVVIGPVTPTNYSTVNYYPASSVSNSSTVTNCLKNYNFIKRHGKMCHEKKAPDLDLTLNVQGICNFISNVVVIVTSHVRVL